MKRTLGDRYPFADMNALIDHNQTLQRNLICCLLFLEIADYDARPVFDQIRAAQDLRKLLFGATAQICQRDLVCIEREDRALLSFLADPQECFRTALEIREAAWTHDVSHNLALRIGINLGTVQVAYDEFGRPHISGQGRQDAERVMRLGPPGQISVSRAFFELLARTAPTLSGLLEYQGLFSDPVAPPLCLYRLSRPQSAEPETRWDGPCTQVNSTEVSVPSAGSALRSNSRMPLSGRWRLTWLRNALLPMLVGIVLLIPLNRSRIEDPAATGVGSAKGITQKETALGVADPSFPLDVAAAMMRPTETPLVAIATPGAGSPLGVESPSEAQTGAAQYAGRGQKKQLVTPEQAGSAVRRLPQIAKPDAGHVPVLALSQHRNALLHLAVKPWGEVLVDGRSVGITPPLKRFEVPPGRHRITVTNGSLPSYQLQIVLDPEEQITLAHDFACISARESPCPEDLGRQLVFASRFGLAAPPGGR